MSAAIRGFLFISYISTVLLGTLTMLVLPAVLSAPRKVLSIVGMMLISMACALYATMHAGEEFEYCCTNSQIDIYKIMHSSRRKLVASFDMDDIIVCAPARSEPVAEYMGGIRTYDCSSKSDGVRNYWLVIKNKGVDNRAEKLIINPVENILSEMERYRRDAVYITVPEEEQEVLA